MSKLPSTKILEVLDLIARMSPKQRLIANNFYLWMLSIKKGKMTGLWMRVLYVAQQSDCCQDTVIRFLKEFKDIIKVIRRRGRTNSYAPEKIFVEAMEFMDKEKMLNKDKRAVKNWLMGMMKRELEFSYENVGICDPPCRDLRPNPFFYPFIKVQESAHQEVGNFLLDSIPLALWQKKKLMKFSEYKLNQASQDYKWYAQRKEVKNLYGFLLSRVKAT